MNTSNLKTFTYGHNDCDDITIAKQIRDTYNLDSSFLSNPNYCDNLFNKSFLLRAELIASDVISSCVGPLPPEVKT